MAISKARINTNQLNEFVQWDAYSSQTVLEKLKERVSVKDYGAAGDGVSDDTAAIQLAINAAVAAAGMVIFPTGTYKVTSTVYVPVSDQFGGMGVVIRGDGPGSRILVRHSGNAFSVYAPTQPTDQRTKIRIEGLTFRGGAAPYNDIVPSTFIFNEYSINLQLRDLMFMSVGTTTACVLHQRGYGLNMDGCVFRGILGDGLRLRQSPVDSPYYSYVVSLYNCDFSGGTGKAIYLDGGNLFSMRSCVVEQFDRGLYVDPVTAQVQLFNFSLDNVWFENNTTSDIDLLSDSNYWCEGTARHCQFGGLPPSYTSHINLGAKSRICVEGYPSGPTTVTVTGSAGAGFTGLRSAKFVQSGTFAWTTLNTLGEISTPYMKTDTSGNVVATNAFINQTGTTTVASGVTTTLVALTSVVSGTYIVTATNEGSSTPNSWATVGLLTCLNGAWRFFSLQTSTALTLSLSGANLQGSHSVGSPQGIKWTLTKTA